MQVKCTSGSRAHYLSPMKRNPFHWSTPTDGSVVVNYANKRHNKHSYSRGTFHTAQFNRSELVREVHLAILVWTLVTRIPDSIQLPTSPFQIPGKLKLTLVRTSEAMMSRKGITKICQFFDLPFVLPYKSQLGEFFARDTVTLLQHEDYNNSKQLQNA